MLMHAETFVGVSVNKRGPVIVVEDDKVVLGYNRERLEELVP